MKKLDYNEYSVCRMQAKLFEASFNLTESSSPIFIRRFMNSEIASSFDDKSILLSAIDINNIFDLLEEEYGKTEYGTKKYSPNELYWIGYIYRVLCFYYDKSSKAIIRLFPPTNIVKYYYIYHTFDPEYAAERMMEEAGFSCNYTVRGVEILKKLTISDELESLIGKKVHVYIDRPINYNHDGIIYLQNYGYIKDIKAADGEYQDAYVIGINEALEEFDGKVIAVIKRKNDIEDKIVVCEENKTYSVEEIEKFVSFQEKFFKHKIIM